MYGIRSLSEQESHGVSPAAMAAMAELERATGQQFDITSAYRSPKHNEAVGGASKSQHIHGNAFDLNVANMSVPERVQLIQAARAAGFRGIGVYANSLHFDVGPSRAWGPDYTKNSLPSWAAEAVNAPVGNPTAGQGDSNFGPSSNTSYSSYASNNRNTQYDLFNPNVNPMFDAGMNNPYRSTNQPSAYSSLGMYDTPIDTPLDTPVSYGSSDFSGQLYNIGG